MLLRGGQLARCLTTKTRIDAETETLIPTFGGRFVDAPIAFDARQECVSSIAAFGALGASSPQAQAVCVTGDITHTLKAEGFDGSEDGTGRGCPIVSSHSPDSACSVIECDRKRHAGGMCKPHYARFKRHGDPLAGRVAEGEPMAFLQSHVGHTGDECVLWPFATLASGYGSVHADGKTARVHRFMCELAHGSAPSPDLDSAHSCGTRLCINPRHLRWATRSDNMADAVGHGTAPRGELHGAHKLTEDDVLEIVLRLDGGETHDEISVDYAVSRNAISDIASGKNWAWLTGRGQPIVASVSLRGRDGGATAELGDDVAGCLRASSGGGDKAHALIDRAVRRLTPRECERLQGFPDDYTLVPFRRKPAKDEPRYKALGNSMAIPCMRFIGERIAAVEAL
jgi:hypothetical protein